jgi:hypothetical protein
MILAMALLALSTLELVPTIAFAKPGAAPTTRQPIPAGTNLLCKAEYEGDTTESLEIRAKVKGLPPDEKAFLEKVARAYLSVNRSGAARMGGPQPLPALLPDDPDYLTMSELRKLLDDSKFKQWAGEGLLARLGEFATASEELSKAIAPEARKVTSVSQITATSALLADALKKSSDADRRLETFLTSEFKVKVLFVRETLPGL